MPVTQQKFSHDISLLSKAPPLTSTGSIAQRLVRDNPIRLLQSWPEPIRVPPWENITALSLILLRNEKKQNTLEMYGMLYRNSVSVLI